MTHRHDSLHSCIKATLLLKKLFVSVFVAVINKRIKTTSLKSQTSGFEIILNTYTTQAEQLTGISELLYRFHPLPLPCGGPSIMLTVQPDISQTAVGVQMDLITNALMKLLVAGEATYEHAYVSKM